MSLWARTKAGHLAIVGALLFLSCEEDITLLGYKADDRFGVHYWDIPLESNLLLIDSLRTSNLSQETHRFLVGRYTDDLLGEVNTAFYTQYYRTGTLPDSLSFATFDSVTLTLAFDDYYYGSRDVTPQEIAVYELDEELANVLTEVPRYYNNSVKQLGAQIGTHTFDDIDPKLMEDKVANNLDTTYTTQMVLDQAFGQRLFDAAVQAGSATTVEDSLYLKLDLFTKAFKGIVVQSVQGDKILGVSPTNNLSRIQLHYTLAGRQRTPLQLTFSNLAGYSTILSDKTGSDIEGLDTYNQEYLTASGNRYLQNGVGVLTEIKLDNFINHPGLDTISAMIINSAELRIDDVAVPVDGMPAPTQAILRILDDENRLRQPRTEQDTLLLTQYNRTLNAAFVVLDDFQRGDQVVLSYDKDKHTYNGFMTLFIQELFKQRATGGTLLTKLALYPASPPAGKSVNRVGFHADNITLRIYFTVPVDTQIDN
ncbi:MAG TPA: DUF4270 family protein [Cyclobacteriaceae bacterium]|nr:DUF4270 family protein [Cyclobacteriaceae bacterium]